MITLHMIQVLTSKIAPTRVKLDVSPNFNLVNSIKAVPETKEEGVKLISALKFLSADVGRGNGRFYDHNGMPLEDYWLAVLWAIASLGWTRGKNIARVWSMQSDRYIEIDFDKSWGQYNPNHSNPIGIGSLYKRAMDAGWQSPSRLIFSEVKLPQQLNRTSSLGTFFDDLILRSEDVQKMADAEFLIPNMIVRGHVAAYVAPGNGGKTTVFVYLCEQLALLGVDVLYVNVDASPGDLKRHFKHAKLHKYKVVAPDARDGKSCADVIDKLKSLALSDLDLSNHVFIIDTLKKFVDVIDKRMAKELYRLFRSLTVKGATICLLGHTNKYGDQDGKEIYEGTADLRNDLDELIYLDGYKNEANNTLEITTRPDKVRAEFEPKSYIINLVDRSITEPTSAIKIISKEDRDILDLIKETIRMGNKTQKDIIKHVRLKSELSDRKIRSTLLFHSRSVNPEIIVTLTGRAKDLEYSLPDVV